MSEKYALIIGNTEYTDPGLAQLTAPGKDTEDFARVLKDREICAFDDVKVLLNQPESIVREAIDEFFHEKKTDDLLVLYFSGHGVRDELGALYLAVKNTNRFRLRSTAIKSDFIREAIDQSRSRRQVLILDCCNSGAFSQGAKAATGVSIGTATAFEAGYGRIILTASDATQFAWEGDQVIGETQNSLFTHFLVQGLEGEADLDGDGNIAVDELYDYAYEQVKLITPKQTPSKFSSKQQGEIILRHHIRVEDMRPVSLPTDLLDEIEDTRPYVREAAVHKLEKILKGKNIALANAAREALEKIVVDDNTTRRVALLATQVLAPIHEAERAEAERKAVEEAERLNLLKAEETRLAREKAEAEKKALAERKAQREAKRRATPKPKEEHKAEEERKVRTPAKPIAVEQAKEAPVAAGTLTKLQTLVPPRFLYTGIAVVLLVVLALFARSYSLRNMSPETTPTSLGTEEQTVHVNVPTGETLPVTAAVSATRSPKITTASPESVSTNVVITVSVTVSRAYLYKGPALTHGLVVQKAYPQGETFTVLARDSLGLWFLAKAPDGNQGWLYVEWVDQDIDLLPVPIAASIPTAPIAATRKTNQTNPTCNPSTSWC